MLDKAATKRAGLRVEIMRDGWREVRSTEDTRAAQLCFTGPRLGEFVLS